VTDPVAVRFEAELRQIKSMADHTYNITINVPEYALAQVQQMLAWLGGLVEIVMIDREDTS